MRFHHVLLIVNPVARTVSKPTLAVIEKALSADFRLEVSETKERGHANELAAQAVEEGIDLVVVFSGDGTINEAVNALAGTDTALGVIPGGATNILARALDLPTDPVEATGVLIDEGARRRGVPAEPGTRRRPLLRGQLRRGRGRRGDATPRRQVPRHEGEVRPGRVPRGRVGAARRVRGSRARPGGRGRRRRALTVALGHGRPHRPVHVLQGPRSPDDAGGLARLGARRALGAQAERRSVPRVAWQVFGSARHVRAATSSTSTTRPRAGDVAEPFPVQVDGDSLGDHRRLEIELAREALWVVA